MIIMILAYISEINVIHTISLLLLLIYHFYPKSYILTILIILIGFGIQILIPVIYPYVTHYDKSFFILGCQYRNFIHSNLWSSPLLAQVIVITCLYLHQNILKMNKNRVIHYSILDKLTFLQNPLISFIYFILIGMLPCPSMFKCLHYLIGTIAIYIFMINKYKSLITFKKVAIPIELLIFLFSYIFLFNGFEMYVVKDKDYDWIINFETIGLLPIDAPRTLHYISLITPLIGLLLIKIEWFNQNQTPPLRINSSNEMSDGNNNNWKNKIYIIILSVYSYIRFDIPLFWQMVNICISFAVSFWNKSIIMLILSICHMCFILFKKSAKPNSMLWKFTYLYSLIYSVLIYIYQFDCWRKELDHWYTDSDIMNYVGFKRYFPDSVDYNHHPKIIREWYWKLFGYMFEAIGPNLIIILASMLQWYCSEDQNEIGILLLNIILFYYCYIIIYLLFMTILLLLL